MVVVRSRMPVDLDRGRNARGQLRELRLDLINRIDDVGARLLEDRQDDAILVVLIGGDRPVGCASETAWPTSRTRIGAPLR